MKHMPLTTLVLTFLSRTLVTLALSFAFAWVFALSCAQAETSVPFAATSLPPATPRLCSSSKVLHPWE